jgi:hypothetical protein
MEGCPEIAREDMLNLQKFETYETKYKEYVDKATDRRRTYHLMTHGFRKYHNEVRAAIKTLFDKNHQLREAYRMRVAAFNMDEAQFSTMDNKTFGDLYRELCTHQSYMPSQLLSQLEGTTFDYEGKLPAVVVQASSAFREKLRGLPRVTVDQCTARQLKEAFIKMLLGDNERNLADFPSAQSWEQVVGLVLDMDGTAQAHTLLQRIAEAGKLRAAVTPERGERSSAGGGAVRGAHTPRGGGRGGHVQGGEARPHATGGGAAAGGGSPAAEVNDDAWKTQFEQLRAQYKPTEVDLGGCTTYQQRVKRILQIRDTRAREAEMKGMRATLQGSTEPPKPKVYSKPSTGGGAAASRSQLADDEEDQGPTCYNCGERGHIKKDCKAPAKQPSGRRRSPSPRGGSGEDA